MKTIYNLNSEFVDHLNVFKDWVFQAKTQDSLKNKIEWQLARLQQEGRPEFSTSTEFLSSLNADTHDGFPPEQFGVNLNYSFLQKQRRRVDPDFFEEVRTVGNDLDENLQNILGARFCALKMFYPTNGYIAWHTNWNVPGYNIIFTYSPTGNGYWRHIDAKDAKSIKADTNKLVHIDDVPGWHCKVGYFGKKENPQDVVWHAAYTREPRITVSYVVFDKGVWENMVEELEDK